MWIPYVLLTVLPNGYVVAYVGITTDYQQRMKQHRNHCSGQCSCYHVFSAAREYGTEVLSPNINRRFHTRSVAHQWEKAMGRHLMNTPNFVVWGDWI